MTRHHYLVLWSRPLRSTHRNTVQYQKVSISESYEMGYQGLLWSRKSHISSHIASRPHRTKPTPPDESNTNEHYFLQIWMYPNHPTIASESIHLLNRWFAQRLQQCTSSKRVTNEPQCIRASRISHSARTACAPRRRIRHSGAVREHGPIGLTVRRTPRRMKCPRFLLP